MATLDKLQGKIWPVNKQFKMNFYSRYSNSKNYHKKKHEIINLPISKKRELYKCGSKFTTLNDINLWSQFGKILKKSGVNFDVSDQGSIYKPNSTLNNKIGLFYGNIATLEIDVIVNAANKLLLGGGGVDAVIHSAAGNYLLEECRDLNGCKTGQAKITSGYNLPAKFVIHTVGPVGEDPLKLESCYIESLRLAVENSLRIIAFPCISTGVYGYPNKKAAQVVLPCVRTFLEANHKDIDLIIFCLFMDVDKKLYENHLPVYFPVSED